MGTNKCASQSGMTASGTRLHLYDPKTISCPHGPLDHQPQMSTNKWDRQVGTTAPGSRRHIATQSWGQPNVTIPPCPCRWALHAGSQAKWSGLWPGPADTDPKYCPQGPVADGAPATARGPGPGEPSECCLYYRKRRAPETPLWVVFPHHYPGFSCFLSCFSISECYQLRVWGKG